MADRFAAISSKNPDREGERGAASSPMNTRKRQAAILATLLAIGCGAVINTVVCVSAAITAQRRAGGGLRELESRPEQWRPDERTTVGCQRFEFGWPWKCLSFERRITFHFQGDGRSAGWVPVGFDIQGAWELPYGQNGKPIYLPFRLSWTWILGAAVWSAPSLAVVLVLRRFAEVVSGMAKAS